MALKNGTAAFTEFAARFFEETKNRFPACVSLWAKWDPEDLIPFLSDFDSRVVCTDAVGPDDWVEFDRAIGEIHLDLTRTHRDWARILEHTPGVNVTRDEMLDPLLFHPETAQWSHYLGDNEWWPAVEAHHRRQDWGDRHEYCFLRRFLYYYGPYQHGIDPPINLGCYEHKYALHSRLWHYFVPALQAALALVRRRTIRGKFETLCGWREIMPSETVLSRAQEIVERHYEVSELHDEWALARLENELYRVLEEVLDCVKDSITLFDATGPADAVRYKRELAAIAP
ncbi:MAG TPA: hypothetical protein VGX03_38490, partial [Candidatus Binatia bacterium]|nr:hypothetical protein [Candidatus Binatia bacterium]